MTQIEFITIEIESVEFDAIVEFNYEASVNPIFDQLSEYCSPGEAEAFELINLEISERGEYRDFSWLLDTLTKVIVQKIKDARS